MKLRPFFICYAGALGIIKAHAIGTNAQPAIAASSDAAIVCVADVTNDQRESFRETTREQIKNIEALFASGSYTGTFLSQRKIPSSYEQLLPILKPWKDLLLGSSNSEPSFYIITVPIVPSPLNKNIKSIHFHTGLEKVNANTFRCLPPLPISLQKIKNGQLETMFLLQGPGNNQVEEIFLLGDLLKEASEKVVLHMGQLLMQHSNVLQGNICLEPFAFLGKNDKNSMEVTDQIVQGARKIHNSLNRAFIQGFTLRHAVIGSTLGLISVGTGIFILKGAFH